MNEFIAPIQPDNVAGVNVEYDDEFLALMAMLQDRPEQQYGDLVVEASVKDWNAIHQACRNILTYKSKDLVVMGYYTQSAIVLRGVAGLSEGLDIITANIDEYWEQIFPSLIDEEGEYDPDYRINALSLFFSYDGLIKELKNAPLVKNGLSGKWYLVKEIEELLDGQQDDYPGGNLRLAVDLRIAMDDVGSPISQLQRAHHNIQRIKSIFNTNGIHEPLKFDVIEQLTRRILALLDDATQTDNNHRQDKPIADTTSRALAHESPTKLDWSNYQVSSRQDAQFLLEKICQYFERHEPSHPAPLFIRRIQKLMNLNFYEIMRDISPESLDRLDNLVGQPINPEDDI